MLILPVMGFSQSEMEEKHYRITSQEAEMYVARALEAKGAGAKVSATMTGLYKDAVFEHTRPVEIVVKTLRFDRAKGRWSGNLLFTSQGQVLKAIPAEGRFEQQVEVPVLRNKMVAGEVIEQEDMELVDLPESRVRKGMVMEPADLAGKVVRRVISAGRPVRADEVQSPQLVRKGAAVQMLYRSAGMEIKATGEALEPGGMGDTIRIRNEASKAVVHGVVSGPDEVTVASPVN